ncbi:MAG: PLP-dependent aminotransferase family protein, partial [Synergistaceae bacterium]|nr:PLP-dependent aminotransferase family protein [Synergistaceae bacterium]
MFSHLDSSAHKTKNDSLYLQLHNNIEREIINGTLRPGDKLPSYRRTAQRYGINISTVIHAYEMLEETGIISIVQGSGCYVKALHRSHFFSEKIVLENFNKGQVFEQPLINFSSATPYIDIYPTHDFEEILIELAKSGLSKSFAYREAQGNYHLRQRLREYFEEQGVKTQPECIQILNGSQQGIDLLCKSIIDPSSVMLAENPSYTVALNTFTRAGATILSIPVNEEGMDIKSLERILEKRKIHFLYCMPVFQCPTSVCLSEANSFRLMELAERHNFLIIEDDCQSEIYFDEKPHALLKSRDTNDRVVYLKSFSKILMPGLRLGCMILPKKLVDRVVSAKFYSDISSPDLQQQCFERFLRKGKMSVYLEKLRAHFRKKYDLMKNLIEKSGVLRVRYVS